MWDDWKQIENAQARAGQEPIERVVVPFPVPTAAQEPRASTIAVHEPHPPDPPFPEPLTREQEYRGLKALRKAIAIALGGQK